MVSLAKSVSVVHQGRCGNPRGVVFALGVLVLLAVSVAPSAEAGPIHEAITSGDRAAVEALLRQDPSLVRAPNENATRDLPLHTAAIAGQVEIAKLLLDGGADIECADSDGSTPLDCAAVFGRPEMVRLLLSRGADFNRRDKNGAYSLSFAASGGDSACVGMLLDAGADLNLFTPQGTTLWHYACSRGLWRLAERLVAAGSDINRGDREGVTPLHLLSQGRHPEPAERAERAIALGASVAAADSEGMTPLHIAVMFDRPEIARVLLSHGADANATDDGGSTPIIWASRDGAPMVRLLLENGARAEVKNSWGETPLLAAAEAGNAESVDLLLQAGADPTSTESAFGMTPLHLAALLGYRDVAELLLSRQAEVNVRDREGRTPLDLAVQYGHRGVVEALAANGADAASRQEREPSAPFVMPRARAAEAFVWSLGHSGWAVKTKNHLLVFDAGVPGRNPDLPSLRNGSINPVELAGEKVAVFVSHEHADHYDPAIFGWKAQLPRVRYLLGFRPRPASAPAPGQAAASAPAVQANDYDYLPPGQTRSIDGMKVTTIESTDSGVGFLVEVDGVAIFHAGDHANRYRDMSGPFRPQIDGLVAKGARPDLAFLPVSGCNFGDQVAVKIGVEYQLAKLQPKAFFPMHGGKYGVRLRDFVTGLGPAYPATAKAAALSKGDSFHYRDGKLL